MAKSKFEYVRRFEKEDACLPNCWIVVRIDGRGFHRFSDDHKFEKPNDEGALLLMNKCAECVMNQFKDIVIAYGVSDEYSFVFRKETTQFSRRASKLMSNLVSLFSSCYVFHWKEYMKQTSLQYPPAFDARVILYPSNKNLRDYLSWRQADCHINNLYNTCFWKLIIEGHCSNTEAEERLKGTLSSDKNELLFSEFGINYNELEEFYRKGTILIWNKVDEEVMKLCRSKDNSEKQERLVLRSRRQVLHLHTDIIGDSFWAENPGILE